MSSVMKKIPAWARALCVCATAFLPGADGAAAQIADLVSKTTFRVCADPANLPMSDKNEQGFENRLADLFAEKLGLPVEYTWYPMATGFIRNTLRANRCDVVIGFAQGHELVQNTNHYMTSAYTLITKVGGPLANVDTLADPRLKGATIGVVAGSPPASHMTRNGLMTKVHGYDLMVDRRYESPIVDMLTDLEAGRLDAAALWGPIAGPLVKQGFPDLKVTPLLKETLPPRLFFRITMGVRLGEKVWEHKLNALIRRNQSEINTILTDAGVPLTNDMGTAALNFTP